MPQRLRPPNRSGRTPHPLPCGHLFHHDVYELARHHDHLHHRLAVNPRHNLCVPERRSLHHSIVASCPHLHHVHQLAVHLHRNLRLILPPQRLIRHRPRRPQHLSLPPHLVPQLRRTDPTKRRPPHPH